MSISLFSDFDLNGLSLPNRVVLAPLTRARSGPDRIPNMLMAEYYRQRATAGLMISEATAISPGANGWEQSPGIYTEQMLEGWRSIVGVVHNAGGRIFLQLWHTGRASHSHFLNGALPVAPSAIAIEGDGVHTAKGKLAHEVPRELAGDEILGIVEEYREATRNAVEAGFDGVEIHSANGYLLDQFLQSSSNQRSDSYGGSIENRYRFLDEVVAAVAGVIGPSRVGVRLSPNGAFNGMGSPDFREQFMYVAKRLDGFGLAYLHVMDGLAFGFHELGEPMTLADIRSVFTGPLMGNCGYTQELAEERISSGDADLIAFGRPYISNPDLVERFATGATLNPDAELSDWYTPQGEKGYTDFPTLESAN